MWTTRDGSFFTVLLAVGLGAAFGAMLRWAISYWFNRVWDVMPAGTLLCNLVGAFVIGLVTAYLALHPAVPACHAAAHLLGSFAMTGAGFALMKALLRG